MPPAWLRLREDSLEVRVRVVPRASRSRIAGVVGEELKLQVSSPPVDGAANRAVAGLLAEAAGLPLRDVELVSGERGRSKTLRLRAADPAAVAKKLEEAALRDL